MGEAVKRIVNTGSRMSFLAKLNDILGAEGISSDRELIEPWLTDWRGRYHGKTLVMASPSSIDQLCRTVELCHAHAVPIVPQGGNSGMVGGATPDDSGQSLLLSLRRMDDLAIDAEGKTATCHAGVVLQTLHERAQDAGLRFPLSLGGKGSATIGGLTSTNAGGTQVLRHGVMRALVLGLKVVLADGRLLDLGSDLKKDNRGFDLKQMFVGAEGTLGIIAEIKVRLVPAVAARKVVWAGVPSLAVARQLLLHCEIVMGDSLEGFEILPQVCLDNVLAYLPDRRPPLNEPHAWHALLEFVTVERGSSDFESQVEACLASAFEADLIEDAAVAANEKQADDFWQLRESIAPAEKAMGKAVQHDISVAPADMPNAIERLSDLVAQTYPGHAPRAFGHLGDGNIHFHVVAPQHAASDWDSTVAKAISADVYRFVTKMGGSISAEHGIGQDKRDILKATRDPVALDVMRCVKHALDPANLMNPGKLVDLAE